MGMIHYLTDVIMPAFLSLYLQVLYLSRTDNRRLENREILSFLKLKKKFFHNLIGTEIRSLIGDVDDYF